MRATDCAISSLPTGRFSSALVMPCRSLCSSNGSRLPSPLTTRGITRSAVSKVVKRSPQLRHSRRRLIWLPSAARRESVTFVSTWLQKGQCTTAPQRASVPVHREATTQLVHLGAHARDERLLAVGVEHVGHPAGHQAHLGLAEAAGGRRRCPE